MNHKMLATLFFGLLAIGLGACCNCGETAEQANRDAIEKNLPGLSLYKREPDTSGVCGWIATAWPRAGDFNRLFNPGDWPANNDCARSYVVRNVKARTLIRFFDDGNQGRHDDWCEIWAAEDVPYMKVWSFEQNIDNGPIRMRYYHRNGLDGKISSAEVQLDQPWSVEAAPVASAPPPTNPASNPKHDEALKALKRGKTIDELSAGCRRVQLPDSSDPPAYWPVMGHNPGGVYDKDTGTLLALYWENMNPADPPDPASGLCMGSECHWALVEDLNYWTTAIVCEGSDPPTSFFAW